MPRLLLLVAILLLAAARASKLPTPPAGYAYWGIHAGAAWYASDAQSEMLADEARVGRKFDVDRIYNIWNEAFPFSTSSYYYWTAQQGRIPFISLQPLIFSNGVSTIVPWKDIAAGLQDAYINATADRLKAFPYRIFFCFHHEPDLDVCPNNISPCDFSKYYGSSSEYVAAYTRLRTLFDQRGVVNCTYVTVWTEIYWNSNVTFASSFYPGSSVVDWLGLDAYNFIASSTNYAALYTPLRSHVSGFYSWASQQNLPLVLAEYGCKEYRVDLANGATWQNNSKPAWYTQISSDWTQFYPGIKAFLQFDVANNARDDWRFNTSQASQCSFAQLGLTAPFHWWNSGAQVAQITGSLPAICSPATTPPATTATPATTAAATTATPTTTTRTTANTVLSTTSAALSISGASVSGASVTGTSVTGATITGGTVTGGGSVTGGAITGAAVTANSITGASVTGAAVTGGTLSGAAITGAEITGATITANSITGGAVTGGSAVTTGTISAGSSKGGGKSLSGGAIAGIVIGVIAALVICAVIVYFAAIRGRRND